MKTFISFLFILVFANAVMGQVKKTPKKSKNNPQIITSKPLSPKSKQISKAGQIILQAKQSYLEGVNYLAEKKSVLARACFDMALAILSNADVPAEDQPKIVSYYEQLQDSIYLLETGQKPPPKSIAENSKGKSKLPKINSEETFVAPKSIPLNQERTKAEKTIILQPEETSNYAKNQSTKQETEMQEPRQTPQKLPELIKPTIVDSRTDVYEVNKPKLSITSGSLWVSGWDGALLLDKSLIAILKDSGVKPIAETGLGIEYDLVETFRKALKEPDSKKYKSFMTSIRPLIALHLVRTIQIGEMGHATVENVPFGNYYVFSFWKDIFGVHVWDLPLKMDEEKESIELQGWTKTFSYKGKKKL